MEPPPAIFTPAINTRILIVEDHDGYRRMVRRLLIGAGMDVVGEAGDGCAGLLAVRHWAPDLVLTDHQMPVMDGLTMARLIKVGPQPPAIILLTAEAGQLCPRELAAAGVDALLEKGCDVALIIETAQRLLGPHCPLAGRMA